MVSENERFLHATEMFENYLHLKIGIKQTPEQHPFICTFICTANFLTH